ncbi:MAG: VacJ family lipoprotein [Pseudomonadota bacterium]
MSSISVVRLLGIALLAGAVAACSSPGPGAPIAERDPFENTNRRFHKANVFLDRNLVRPAAQGYDFVTPATFQFLLGNAIDHLDSVGDFANYVIQGDVDNALVTFGRFVVNTVLGAGGLLDPATEFDLPKGETDFGVTLGKYGVGEGAYLVLPLLGPSTTRDAWGSIVDRTAFNPRFYVGVFVDGTIVDAALPAATVFEVVEARARNADLVDDILYESADSYVTLRSIFLQRRDALIGGTEASEDLPDIFDEENSN